MPYLQSRGGSAVIRAGMGPAQAVLPRTSHAGMCCCSFSCVHPPMASCASALGVETDAATCIDTPRPEVGVVAIDEVAPQSEAVAKVVERRASRQGGPCLREERRGDDQS